MASKMNEHGLWWGKEKFVLVYMMMVTGTLIVLLLSSFFFVGKSRGDLERVSDLSKIIQVRIWDLNNEVQKLDARYKELSEQYQKTAGTLDKLRMDIASLHEDILKLGQEKRGGV